MNRRTLNVSIDVPWYAITDDDMTDEETQALIADIGAKLLPFLKFVVFSARNPDTLVPKGERYGLSFGIFGKRAGIDLPVLAIGSVGTDLVDAVEKMQAWLAETKRESKMVERFGVKYIAADTAESAVATS